MDLAGIVTVRVEADLTPLEQGFDKAKKAAQDFDQQVSGSAKDAIRELGTSASEFGDEVAGSFKKVVTAANDVGTATTEVAGSFTKMVEVAKEAGTTTGAAFSNVNDNLKGANDAIKALANGFSEAAGGMKTVGSSLAGGTAAAKEFGDTVTANFTAAAGGMRNIVQGTIDWGNASNASAGKVVESLEKVDDKADELAKSLRDMWEGSKGPEGMPTVESVADLKLPTPVADTTVTEAVKTGAESATGAVNELNEALKAMMAGHMSGDQFNMIVEKYGTMEAAVASYTKELEDAAKEVENTAASAAGANIGAPIAAGAETATGAVAELNEALKALGQAFNTGDTDQIATALANVEEKTKSVVAELTGGSKEAADAVKDIEPPLDLVGQALDAVKKKAMEFGAAFVAAFTLEKFISETSNLEHEQARLASALESTGNAAGQTLEGLNAHADALKQITEFSGGAISGAQALLLTFENVRGDNFERATDAILDMSSALGRDLTSSARMVGQALNDPVNGLGRLRQAGIRLSEGQKLLIQDLIASGDFAKAQSVILGQLEKAYHGAAAAARDTLGGALTQLSKNFDDAFALSKSSSEPLRAAIEELAAAIARPEFKEAVATIGTAFFQALTMAAKAAEILADNIDLISFAVQALLAYQLVGWIGRVTIALTGLNAAAGVSGFVGAVRGMMSGATVAGTAIGMLEGALGRLAMVFARISWPTAIIAAVGWAIYKVADSMINGVSASEAYAKSMNDLNKEMADAPEKTETVAQAVRNGAQAHLDKADAIMTEVQAQIELMRVQRANLQLEMDAAQRMNRAAGNVQEIPQHMLDAAASLDTQINSMGMTARGAAEMIAAAKRKLTEAEREVKTEAYGPDPIFDLMKQFEGATGGIVSNINKINAANDNLQQGMVGTHRSLVDGYTSIQGRVINLGDIAMRANLDWLQSMRQVETQLKSQKDALAAVNRVLEEGASQRRIESFFTPEDIENIEGAKEALEGAATSIDNLFTKFANHQLSARQLDDELGKLKQALIDFGLPPAAVNAFVDAMRTMQEMAIKLGLDVKDTQAIIDGLKGKTVNIGVVTTYSVQKTGGAPGEMTDVNVHRGISSGSSGGGGGSSVYTGGGGTASSGGVPEGEFPSGGKATGGGAGAGIYHEGGVVGAIAAQSRYVDPKVFEGAPKFATGGIAGGVSGDEVPAILHKGEVVLPTSLLGGAGNDSSAQKFVNAASATTKAVEQGTGGTTKAVQVASNETVDAVSSGATDTTKAVSSGSQNMVTATGYTSEAVTRGTGGTTSEVRSTGDKITSALGKYAGSLMQVMANLRAEGLNPTVNYAQGSDNEFSSNYGGGMKQRYADEQRVRDPSYKSLEESIAEEAGPMQGRHTYTFKTPGVTASSSSSETRNPGDPGYGTNAPVGQGGNPAYGAVMPYATTPTVTNDNSSTTINNNIALATVPTSQQSLAELSQKLSASVISALGNSRGRA